MQPAVILDDAFKELEVVAELSDCSRLKTAARLYDAVTGIILCTDFNRPPHILAKCSCEGKARCYSTIHAEQSCLILLPDKYKWVPKQMVSLYKPCIHCLKMLIAYNVHTVYYMHEYTMPDDEQEQYDKLLPLIHLLRYTRV